MDLIPVFKVGELLLVTIETDVRDEVLEGLQGSLGARIRDTGARGVLIDISQLRVIDHVMAGMLQDTAALTRVLGAESVLVGMRPAVAMTLLDLEMRFDGIATAVDVASGIELLRNRLADATPDDEDDRVDDEQETAPHEAADAATERTAAPQG